MRIWTRWLVCCLAVTMLLACGKQQTSTVTDSGHSEGGPNPCSLLSADQVAKVLPGADDGYVAASGGSLVKGIDSYQCSYSDQGSNMLLVVFHTAASGQLFDDIKPKDPSWAVGEANVRRVTLGDGGWLERTDDGVKLEASRGHLVIELTLDAPDARGKEDSVIALGQTLLDALQNQLH